MTRLRSLVLAATLLVPICLLGDAGVLVPSGSRGPDPAILSLDDLLVDVDVDNGDARVAMRQVFGSHVPGVLEGEYLFSLPGRATVSDFAVWDAVTRIPGVILERRRAEEIYEGLRQQHIDPGLLQAGERGAEGAGEASRTSVFSARIVPIPGYGTKRLELEYHETVPVENLKAVFALPLHPDAYNAQSAKRMRLTFSLTSAHAIGGFKVTSHTYPLQMHENTSHRVSGTFDGTNVTFTEDFAVEYSLGTDNADSLAVITHRAPGGGGALAPHSSAVRCGGAFAFA
jgi:Ca-activated chloride channel family protein